MSKICISQQLEVDTYREKSSVDEARILELSEELASLEGCLKAFKSDDEESRKRFESSEAELRTALSTKETEVRGGSIQIRNPIGNVAVLG